ncbi:MAG: outer membrane beta-barrel domain-containing protein [Proteobacteria bacterium]|nr:outer membrane beta-barrel domain-containing protein [Pseudomonadota bacterium]
MNTLKCIGFLLVSALTLSAFGAETEEIEKQLSEIGSISKDEVLVVQKKFTRKEWRHEITPFLFGGIPFGTVRRTMTSGGSYTLHLKDWFALEPLNFTFSKNFFTSFTDDINTNSSPSPNLRPDPQRILYFLTTGVQLTPIYGKVSTLSRWLAYVEPYFGLGAGLAKTETDSYFTFYPAVGMRVYFREWFSMKLELRDYMYTEQTINPTTQERTPNFRNNYQVGIALSFWLPKMPR